MSKPNDELKKIYRKADEISSALLEDFKNQYGEMSHVFTAMSYPEKLAFDSIIALKSHRTTLRKSIQDECLKLDYLYFSPPLIDSLSVYYENSARNEGTTLGVAIKHVLGFIWTGSYHQKAGDLRSYVALKHVIAKTILFLLFESVIRVWEQVELHTVVIGNDGIVISAEYLQFAQMLMLQGRHEYKVLEQAKSFIWENNYIDHFLDGIINGTLLPKDVFGNSFLAEVSPKETDFWSKLWALSRIMLIAVSRNNTYSRDLLRMSLISEGLIPSRSSIPPAKLQQTIFNCFWRQDWHREQINKDSNVLQSMIVERPCIRIRDVDNLFATSPFLIIDAINNCMERYIHKNDRLYEKYFTKPFEDRVSDILRKYGFRCGEVSESGIWMMGTGNISLDNPKRMPGQIDILALAPNQNQALLIDCKLVHFPYQSNTLRNVIAKFDDCDTDEFHKKIEKKRNWLKGCSQFKNIEIINAHITNIYIPIQSSDKIVLTVQQMEKYLSEEFELI